MSEAKSIKNRLVSSTTNAVCTYTIDDALAAFNMMDFCLVILDASMSASDDHNILKAMRASRHGHGEDKNIDKKSENQLKKLVDEYSKALNLDK